MLQLDSKIGRLLEVSLGDFNHITGQDWDRSRQRIVAHAAFAAALNLNGRAACSISRPASDCHCREHIQPALVRIFPWLCHLTHHIKGPKRRNRNSDFWIFEIFAAEFLRQRLLKFALCQAYRLQ